VSKRDYPTNRELKQIATWPYERGSRSWFEFIESIWWSAEWGFRKSQRRYYVSTGGWSGNEEIIAAMRKNFILWSQCWISVRRGGHYVFGNFTINGGANAETKQEVEQKVETGGKEEAGSGEAQATEETDI